MGPANARGKRGWERKAVEILGLGPWRFVKDQDCKGMITVYKILVGGFKFFYCP
jgi:hypothetical protein